MRTNNCHTAVANAIGFFERSREPHALLWLVVMHRRFGIPQFADALQRYDQALIEQPEKAPLGRVMRRFADRENPLKPDDWDAVVDPSDRIIVTALYCDRLGLPASFAEVLGKAARAGGYYLPHVLLTLFCIQENRCELALPNGFISDLYRANAKIIDDPRSVTDLKLEAAAFLYLVGQGALVDGVFIETVITVQNDDGGWGHSRHRPGNSDWHATILGLLLLLHVKALPAPSKPPQPLG